MTLIGCWRFTGTPTQNGVVTEGKNETTPLRSDSLLGEFAKAMESRIGETAHREKHVWLKMCITHHGTSVTPVLYRRTYSCQEVRLYRVYTPMQKNAFRRLSIFPMKKLTLGILVGILQIRVVNL